MALPPAAQVQSNYDPNAATYLPGTQDQGDTPALKPAVQKAPATPTLPVANPGLSTGTLKAPANNPTVPVAGQTSDPLAFATGTFNTTGSPATQGQQANPQGYGDAGAVTPNASNTVGGTTQPPVYTPPPLYSGPNAPPDTRAMSGQDAAAAQQAYNDSTTEATFAGLDDAQKAALAEKNASVLHPGQPIDWSGYAAANTQTGTTGNPNAGGSVATYTQDPSKVANLNNLVAYDPMVAAAQSAQNTNLAQENLGIQSQNTQNNANSIAALDAALNGQPGYAGSGNAYADPNNPGQTVANPLDAAHTAPTPDQLGTVVSNTTQNAPTDQGGTATTTYPGNGYVGNGPQVDPTTLAYQQSHPTGTPGSTPITQASTGTPGSTVANAGPVNSQPTLTPLTPDNALTNSIISPNSNVDRFAVAKQQIQDEIQNELEPQFNADARTVAAQSFGAGRGVSGANRTAEGNLALQHSRDINQLTSNYLNPALTGTIQDTLNNANFAAGQQQFEAGQQNTAYNQQTGLQQLADSENQQQFSQALQKLIVGSQGDPAQLQLLLSELYGGQSAQSSQAAQNLAKSAVG